MKPLLTIILPVLLLSCGSPLEEAPPPVELPTGSVTRWSDRTELFMEHPALIAGQTARFAIHFTHLADFSPVTTGRVTVRLRGPATAEFSTDGPSSPGIFGVDVTPRTAGTHTIEVSLSGSQVSDVVDAGPVPVYGDAAQAAASVGELPESEGISFLKEQQWTLEFGTAIAAERALRDTVPVTAEIRPRPGGDTVVTAPIAGRLVLAAPRSQGSTVRAGDLLAELVPRTVSAGDRASLELDLANAQSALRLAAAERGRAERLVKEGALPGRRAEEARVAEERAQAAVDTARARLAQVDVVRTGGGEGMSGSRYVVRAPIAGVVTASNATPGSTVEEGELLFRIVAIDAVQVVAHVPQNRADRLPLVTSAELLSSAGDPVPIGRLLSKGRVADPTTRAVPVVFEWRQPDPRFVIGQTVQARLLTDPGPPGVAVAETALVDDAGRPVVFVQIEGERFERRPVRLGRREGGFVEITDGVAAGERVVTRGAPLVRLTALSTQVPAHGHVH